jgi:hypothetical protein
MIYADMIFHPVGQGLFVSGTLATLRPHEECFTWVYDCGSDAFKTLKPELADFLNGLHHKPLEMVFVSHFDKDHVNGVCELLKTSGAKAILLPYMPLAHRMLIAVDQNISGWYLRFLVDPASYLLSISPESSIYYVRGGSPPPEPPPDYGVDGPEQSGGDDHDLDWQLPAGTAPDEDDFPGTEAFAIGRVRVISHSQPLRVGARWEFVFYNEQRTDVNILALTKIVSATVKTEHIGKHKYSRGLIAKLRTIYGKYFGTSSSDRNRISLVVYAGPRGIKTKLCLHGCFAKSSLAGTFRFWNLDPIFWHPKSWQRLAFSSWRNAPCVLLTGDIPLNKIENIRAIKRHLGIRRWSRIQALQVPHHGALSSWTLGSSQLFSNEISVMSAGVKNRYGHPSAAVFADLSAHGPVHVSERKGLYCVGWT